MKLDNTRQIKYALLSIFILLTIVLVVFNTVGLVLIVLFFIAVFFGAVSATHRPQAGSYGGGGYASGSGENDDITTTKGYYQAVEARHRQNQSQNSNQPKTANIKSEMGFLAFMGLLALMAFLFG